jgi:methylated-DNA-[protein]-cysteine S-methyltransferase
MPPLRIAPFETPLGRCWVAATRRGVLAILRSDDPVELFGELGGIARGAEAEIDPRGLAWATGPLAAYFAGEPCSLDMRVDPGGASLFDRRVWEAVRAIPYGRTASYGAVAVAAGSPRGARAVGAALARCRLTPIVPCHRVIHASGDIGGWGEDMASKRWLLGLETGALPGPMCGPER